MLAYLGFIIFYVAACWLIGYLGRDGKFTFYGNFWVSVILTPFIGVLVLLAQDNRKKEVQVQDPTK